MRRVRAWIGGGLRAELARTTGGTALISLASRGLALATTVLLARLMGPMGFGRYTTALAVVMLLGIPATFGLPTLTVRLVPAYQVREQWGLLRGFLLRADQTVLVLALGVGGLAALGILYLASIIGYAYATVLWVSLALLPLTALTAVRSAAVRALSRVVAGQLPENVVVPGIFVVLVLGWWGTTGWEGRLSPLLGIAVRLVAVAAGAILSARLLAATVPMGSRRAPARFDDGAWLRSAAPLLAMGGLAVVNTRTDVLLLSMMRGAESAGIFQTAARGAEFVSFGLAVVNLAVLPTFSRLYATADLHSLQRVATAVARVAIAFAAPLGIVMILKGKVLISAVFGVDYAPGALALALLSVAQVVNAGMGSAGQILTMSGNERAAAVGTALGAGFNVALNLLFIPLWGIEGAAAATTLSLILWNLFLSLQVLRRIGVDPTALGLLGQRH